MAITKALEISSASVDVDVDDDGKPCRTGTMWSGVAHIITAVIGSGVLSLSWSMAQLGWIAGPVTLFAFAFITYISSCLLADCYRSSDPVKGPRNCSYIDAVRTNLGRKSMWACGVIQYVNLIGTSIAYQLTTSTSMGAIQRSNCYHRNGKYAPCKYGSNFWTLVFGAVQIVMSQIPNMQHMEWVSVIAAAMSFGYSSIGLGLGLATVIGNGRILGTITGVPTTTPAKKVWNVFVALGDIGFAYPFGLLLLEIQDTLKSPPAENRTMKKASLISVSITTFFYFCCGCFGYAAFGNSTPGNLLTGFGFYEPYWLVDLANACIILHLVGGYLMYSQPVFAAIDRWFTYKYPNNRFISKEYRVKIIPLLPSLRLSPFRLCARTLYVGITTIIAMTFPYFNSVLGLLGGINFWPLAIYFPVEMYIVQMKIGKWSKRWLILRSFSFICFLLTAAGFIGSLESIISAKMN